jgi:GT2 family glycosyltransferase
MSERGQPRVAILCNWWNHPELLDDFCEAVAGEAWDELVVVDNASEPDAARQIAGRIGELGGRVLRRETNGQLGGVRESVAATASEILILLNNDVRRKRSGWVERLAACITPGVLAGHQLRAKLGVRYLEGWCLGVLRSDWERLGGYDPACEEPPYWADTDLSFRAQQLGMQLHAGDFGLEHLRNGSVGAVRDTWWCRARRERSRLRIVAKLESAGGAAPGVDWEIPGINFFAPLSGNFGQAVAARSWLRFLLEAGVEVFAVDVPDRAGRSGHDSEFLPIAHSLDERAPHAVNLFAMNPWSLRWLADARHPSVELGSRLNAMIAF